MRAVVDTNVFVSALISPNGPPDAILRAWRQGRFQIITSAPLLAELATVLARPAIRKRTGFSLSEDSDFVAALARAAIIANPEGSLSVFADDADNRLLEAAVTAGADYIVSGDLIVLNLGSFRGAQIVNPGRFLATLHEQAED